MRKTAVVLMVIMTTLVAAAPGGAEAPPGALAVAERYGLESWDQIEELRYTFNVRAGEREVRRSWVWRVADRTVTYRDEIAGGEPVHYSQDDVGEGMSEELKQVDHRFINDQYWLLFALHVAWDGDADVTEAGAQPLPIGEGTAAKITVQYPEEGGYTPGDAYDIYVGDDGYVVQWVYRQGGQPEPSLAATWEDHRRVGPIVVPTRFRSEDGNFELWFSGVAARLKGSGKLIEAE